MPHQCTGCGHVFEDGSKEMLGGCPECGGTKFQFHPAGAEIPEEPTDADPPDRPERGGMAERVGRATTSVRDWVGGGEASGRDAGVGAETGAGTPGDDGLAPWPDSPDEGEGDAENAENAENDDEIIDADRVEARLAEEEGAAQASARGDIAGPDEVAASGPGSTRDPDREPGPGDGPPDVDGEVVAGPERSDQGADLQQLREELNDQFESIKVIEPGQYELNLMGLYDREEYVVALQENGRYVIQMPDDWGGRPPDE